MWVGGGSGGGTECPSWELGMVIGDAGAWGGGGGGGGECGKEGGEYREEGEAL